MPYLIKLSENLLVEKSGVGEVVNRLYEVFTNDVKVDFVSDLCEVDSYLFFKLGVSLFSALGAVSLDVFPNKLSEAVDKGGVVFFTLCSGILFAFRSEL
jgi:hypothetical protein